jgi:nitrate reductase delta subunit
MKLRRRRLEPPYKLLSLLLQYPDRTIIAAEDEIVEAVGALEPSPYRDALQRFCAAWVNLSPIERAEHYVRTFDLQKQASLYLTYYLHGDKRQRGAELGRLTRLYAAGGMVLDGGSSEGGELPDYLPVMLEFAAFAPSGYGQTLLAEFRPALEVLRTRLHDLASPYAHLLDAVCHSLPALTLPQIGQIKRLIAEGPPTEQVGLEPSGPMVGTASVGAPREAPSPAPARSPDTSPAPTPALEARR